MGEGGPITFTCLQFLDSEAFGQSDLEDLEAAHVSCQPGQALLAAATHSDQEGITLRGLEDSTDTTPGERRCARCSVNSFFRQMLNSSFHFRPLVFVPLRPIKDAARICLCRYSLLA